MRKIPFLVNVLLIVSAGWLAAPAVHAQQARMHGSVFDEAGSPVEGAKIVLEPVEGGTRAVATSKGKKGGYLFGILRPGVYRVSVEASGMVLVSMTARGSNPDNPKEDAWKIDGRVRTDKPPQFRAEDAMDIKADFVLGKAQELKTAEGGTVAISADDALRQLTSQVQGGDCAGALPQLTAFTTANPTSGRAFYLQGYCEAVTEHDDAAVASLTKSIELDPAFAGTRSLLGRIHARNKRFAEAESELQKEVANESAPPSVLVDAWLSLGSVYAAQNKDAEAIAAFEKVNVLAPERPEAYLELSTLYTKAGKNAEAEAILEKAKQAGAANPAAILNVGISYFNKKDYPRAEAMFRKVVEAGAPDPDLAMAWALIGRLELRNGKTESAVAALEKSLALDPKGKMAADNAEMIKALKKK